MRDVRPRCSAAVQPSFGFAADGTYGRPTARRYDRSAAKHENVVVTETKCLGQGRIQGAVKGFIPLKLSKLDSTADAEYVATLANVNM